MQFMQTVKEPYTCLSVNLSECYSSLDSDPTFVEMLARVLYHVTINCYYISADGKYHQDVADYELFMDAIWSFASKYNRALYRFELGSKLFVRNKFLKRNFMDITTLVVELI